MGTLRDDLTDLMRQLERECDELRLKMHLGKAEARDEWEKLEKRWKHVRGRSAQIKDVVDDTARNVGDAAMQAAREIRAGYERIRRMM